MSRPKFTDLTDQERLDFGNGVGPYWLPEKVRHVITQWCSWFFDDASWRHHDFGYSVGGDEFDRIRCDWKFFVAMCRDSMTQNSFFCFLSVPAALIISFVFFGAVVALGWKSFRYDESYADIAQIKRDSRVS